MLFVNTDCLNKKDAEILKAQIEQQAKERRMLEADYEARLKADMVAMLTEIQLELEEKRREEEFMNDWNNGYNSCLVDSYNFIQEKIDKLKG